MHHICICVHQWGLKKSSAKNWAKHNINQLIIGYKISEARLSRNQKILPNISVSTSLICLHLFSYPSTCFHDLAGIITGTMRLYDAEL